MWSGNAGLRVHERQIIARFLKSSEAGLNPRTGSRVLDFPDLVTTTSDSHKPQYRKIYYTTFLQTFESFNRLFSHYFPTITLAYNT